jgi:uncharacterized repeat protein (TIGR01451 family)
LISIVKAPASQSVALGGTARFEITVTNTGNVTLTDVTVGDARSTDCSRDLGALAAGQSRSYSCSKPDVAGDFTNVADVTGKPPTGATVKASAHANVTAAPLKPPTAPLTPPSRPAIAIVKSPRSQTLTSKVTKTTSASGSVRTAVHFATATFTIRVTNTGRVTLHAVRVNDPSSPACDRQIGRLATGASMSYHCSRPAVAMSFTNAATATGLSPSGSKVSATAHARVIVKVKTTSTQASKFTG